MGDPGDMRKYVEDACEEIDAAIFSGDEFHNAESREKLREYMARWERGLQGHDSSDSDEPEEE